MPSVCLILKVHETPRLRPFSFFEIGTKASYRDDAGTLAHLEKVTHRSYLPATRILLKQIKEFRGDFRLAIALSGVTIDLFARFQPELLTQFKRLADTGCVEFLCEPYFHSLAFIFSKPEFRAQLVLHREKLTHLFGKIPTTLHQTVKYNNDVAQEADAAGFNVILAAGTNRILEGRSTNRVYQPESHTKLKLLFETPLLTEAIIPSETGLGPEPAPLSALQFMTRLTSKQGEVITLSADLKEFKEPLPGESNTMEFLNELPGALLTHKNFHFETPSQTVKTHNPCGSVSIPGFTTWEMGERESLEWVSNEMQKDAIHGLYLLEKEVLSHPDPTMLQTWRQLQISDHILYMDTKQLSQANRRFPKNPYHSPYDAYINFMNILTDFSERLTTSP